MPVFPTRMRRSALVALLSLLVVVALPGAASAKVLSKPTWLSKVAVTEYFPAPERWFVGAQVQTPGPRPQEPDRLALLRARRLDGGRGHRPRRPQVPHRLDRLERLDHRARAPRAVRPRRHLRPVLARRRATGRTSSGAVTFPLDGGGWYAGEGKQLRRARATSPSPHGPSRPLRSYRSVAVDPALIPLGSLVYVPAYKPLNKDGWFRADDTGGAIKGRHIDVYRRPPDSLVRQRPLPAGPPHLRRARRRTSRPTCAQARASAGALPADPAAPAAGAGALSAGRPPGATTWRT